MKEDEAAQARRRVADARAFRDMAKDLAAGIRSGRIERCTLSHTTKSRRNGVRGVVADFWYAKQ